MVRPEGCAFPDCPSATVATDQIRQHNEVTKKLDDITENQQLLIRSLNQIEVLLADFNHLSDDFRDFRDITRRQMDSYFERLRMVERDKAESKDLIAMKAELKAELLLNENSLEDAKKTGVSWIWQALIVLLSTVVGAIVGKSCGGVGK